MAQSSSSAPRHRGYTMPGMCFDLDSRPPIPPITGAAVDGARANCPVSRALAGNVEILATATLEDEHD